MKIKIVLLLMILAMLAVSAASTGAGHLAQNKSTTASEVQPLAVAGYYNVTFEETGLPSNVYWYVYYDFAENGGHYWSLNYSANTATHNHISNYLSNGTFIFIVYSVTKGNYTYYPNYKSPNSGYITVIVNGHSITDTITFTKVRTTSPVTTYYHAQFKITNLPSTMNGVYLYYWMYLYNQYGYYVGYNESYSNHLWFTDLTNGTYSFELYWNGADGFKLSPTQGYFQIHGANVTVDLKYSAVTIQTQKTYKFTVTESGLPGSYLFETSVNGNSISVGNESVAGTLNYLTFNLPNGTYSYSAGYSSPSGYSNYSASNSVGQITINGTAVSVTVAFSELGIHFNIVNYASLKSSVGYYLELYNTSTGYDKQYTVTSKKFFVAAQADTYYYSIQTAYGKFVFTPSTGTIKLNTANVTVDINATYGGYVLTIIENGLDVASGYYIWDAEINGNGIHYSMISNPGQSVMSVYLPNGTYTVTFTYYLDAILPLSVNLYSAHSQQVKISGKNVAITADYQPSSSSSSSTLSTYGIPIGVGIAGILVGAGLVALMFRRKPGNP